MVSRRLRWLLAAISALLMAGSLGSTSVAAAAVDSTGTVATRSLEAQQGLVGANGTPLTGAGVSIAVIDTGVDPTHPSFQLPGGSTKVARSLSSTGCLTAPSSD